MSKWLASVSHTGGWPRVDQMCTIIHSYLEHSRSAWAAFNPAYKYIIRKSQKKLL